MFPTEPIRRYIQLSYATKIDENAKTYREEIVKIRLKMSPNSGQYFQAIMLAGVHLQQSSVAAYTEIVRDACREADRPVDREVRTFMLGEIHNMLESGKNHVIQAVAREIGQAPMKPPDNLMPSLIAQANTHISAIGSKIAREFKIEDLKDGIKQSVPIPKPVEAVPPLPIPAREIPQPEPASKSRFSRGEKIALWVGVPPIVIALLTLAAMFLVARWDKSPAENGTKSPPNSATPTPVPNMQAEPVPSKESQAPSHTSPPGGNQDVSLGENNHTSDTLASVAWSTSVEGHDYSVGGIGTSILAWPKAPMKFPATLRIFYTADLVAKPQPTFESSTKRDVSVSDWSTAKNGLTFTIRSGEVDENNPIRIRVYSTTQLSVATVVCLSCK